MLTLHEAATGRGKDTAWWAGESFSSQGWWAVRMNADVEGDAGLPNLFWWCDRENGVAGIIATQILPFCGKVFHLYIWCFVGVGGRRGKGSG